MTAKVDKAHLQVDPAPGSEEAIEAEWLEEARQRLKEHDDGRVTPVPWSEARERIFRREP